MTHFFEIRGSERKLSYATAGFEGLSSRLGKTHYSVLSGLFAAPLWPGIQLNRCRRKNMGCSWPGMRPQPLRQSVANSLSEGFEGVIFGQIKREGLVGH